MTHLRSFAVKEGENESVCWLQGGMWLREFLFFQDGR